MPKSRLIMRWTLMVAGSIISAIGVIVFMTPFDIAPTGITGIAVLLNITLGLPIGVMNFIMNIPLMIWAARMLGGWRVVAWTVVFIVIFSVSLDNLAQFFPAKGVSDEVLLNAIFGGILGGVGSAMVIRAGGTTGGVATLGRVLQEKYGIPLSSTYLYANIGVILLIGAVLGWEGALFAMVAIGVEGAVTDYVLEGPSVIRMGIIITDYPKEVSQVLLYQLRRGVTSWSATGMYTGQQRYILYVTVSRFQIDALRTLVHSIDPEAFLVIAQGHVAYGEGFKKSIPPVHTTKTAELRRINGNGDKDNLLQ
jgi:uncharacterized membrane-anchored protein YitT (DUF2179 family)